MDLAPGGSPRQDSDAALSTAGFLALGSPPQATFPVSQWYQGLRLADYSCGGSLGLGRNARHRVPFDPLAGHRPALDTGRGEAPSTGIEPQPP